MYLHKKKPSAKFGMPPGSLLYIGENPPNPTKLSIHIYDSDSYQNTESFEPELIHKALAKNQHVWIDVSGLADTQLITEICTEFDIHSLIIEDIFNTHQRPKLDELEDCLFFVFRLLNSPPTRVTYCTEQFCMVLKKNLLLTFRESNNYDLTPINQHLSSSTEPTTREQGSSTYLSYLIIDNLVDSYFSFVESSDETLDSIENLLIKNPSSIHLPELYTLKRRTFTMRKIIAPLRDIIHVLVLENKFSFNPKNLLYYHDLLDHTSRLLESIDLQRETITGILEMYISTVNTRMNETIKVLTIFASLFIPLTFIAGIYGMNFVYMPELKWRYSYPAVLLVMLVIAILMIYYFKRKRLF
ncbi:MULTISPECIES: magnesium/cobalt transporter CorA [Legionella]|uniref:Magnesium transport protein CorA n=1 Tax=Legionella drozanskii LLAP-1 TaxID=1212489 RepID=A0A0W0SXP8_9GAMM|nr:MULTISPECIES: magnesium/cobalt transporter CorA [Legionella]KTC88097.1 cobalt/magnesium uptake transporter [Legionella drozanskii LLAP-1]PJE08140.1 MAG: magnesium and cobalt transport protein CorA [Legionella sp.]